MSDTAIKITLPAKDHRFQIIGLDQELRTKFLVACKLNNKSGNEVLKKFMKKYVDENEQKTSQ
jgi:hypothetical protein|tara:strand:- start:365 stop:553 length:189 start_codon:yes stop_codon:yes gene_type:complete